MKRLNNYQDHYRRDMNYQKYKQKMVSEKFKIYDESLLKVMPINRDVNTMYIDASSYEPSTFNARFIIAANSSDGDTNDLLRLIMEKKPNFVVSLSIVFFYQNFN